LRPSAEGEFQALKEGRDQEEHRMEGFAGGIEKRKENDESQ